MIFGGVALVTMSKSRAQEVAAQSGTDVKQQ